MRTTTESTKQQELGGRNDGASDAIDPVRARLTRILEGRDFPALSQQIIETISALDDDASSLQRLTNVVLREYSLTLSVVRTANSAHYRRAGRQIQSATRAMMLLGARTVRQLASSLLLFENYSRRSAGLKELMLLSLLTANHAREVATRLGRGDPEEAHLCGMFRNLGEVLIACHFPDDYARIHGILRTGKQNDGAVAFSVLGFRYEDLGAELCQYWGMPDAVTVGIRARGSSFTCESSAITAFSHDLTNAIYRCDAERGDPRNDLNEVIARYSSRLKLTRVQVREVVESALEETRELLANAKVSVDGLRMRQLSDAACSALGVTALGHSEWDTVGNDSETAALQQLRERLHQELESKVAPDSGCDLGQVLLLAIEGALRGGQFDRVVACVLSPDRARLRARSGLGIGVESLLARFDFPMTPQGGPLPSALLQRKLLYLPSDRAMNAVELKLASTLGIGQFGVFPVVVGGQIVGCLYGDRVAREPLPDRATLQYVVSLTDLVVKAIEARRRASSAPVRQEIPAVAPSANAPAEPSTMTVESKGALVLRLLQGEAVTVVAQSSGVPTAQLEQWRVDFMAGAMARLGGG